jgi:hypothetical protein
VWGRLTYNAAAAPEAALRPLSMTPASRKVASALAQASRILPTVTTAHLPSAACDAYWPEIYWNQPLTAEPRPNPYGDTPAPKVFSHVSALDPELFSTIHEHAAALLAGTPSAKYSPIEVAAWLETLADGTDRDLASVGRVTDPGLRRATIDARIQAGLGRFFAAKLRAGVLHALHEVGGDRAALESAITSYRRARAAWVALTQEAAVYGPDLSVSDKLSERGHWRDRLAGIDADIEALTVKLTAASSQSAGLAAAIAAATGTPVRRDAPCTHQPPASFAPGTELPLTVAVFGPVTSIECRYRHVNQAERFESVAMTSRSGGYHAAIPAAYTSSPYPLQYYFVVRTATAAHLYPGLGAERMGMPYFVVQGSGFKVQGSGFTVQGSKPRG